LRLITSSTRNAEEGTVAVVAAVEVVVLIVVKMGLGLRWGVVGTASWRRGERGREEEKRREREERGKMRPEASPETQ
jgi:hypothetical protein